MIQVVSEELHHVIDCTVDTRQNHLRLLGRALLSGKTDGSVGVNDIRTVLLTPVILLDLLERLYMQISTLELLFTTEKNPPDRQILSRPKSPCQQPA